MGRNKISLNELKLLIKKIINEYDDYEYDDHNYDYHAEDPPTQEDLKHRELYKKFHEYIFKQPLPYKKDIFFNGFKNFQNKTGINKIFPDYVINIYSYRSFLMEKFNERIPNNLLDELVILGDRSFLQLANVSENPGEFLKKNLKNEIYDEKMVSELYEYFIIYGNNKNRKEIAKFILDDNRLYKLLTTYGYGHTSEKPNLYLIKILNGMVNIDKIKSLKKEFLDIQSRLIKLSDDE